MAVLAESASVTVTVSALLAGRLPGTKGATEGTLVLGLGAGNIGTAPRPGCTTVVGGKGTATSAPGVEPTGLVLGIETATLTQRLRKIALASGAARLLPRAMIPTMLLSYGSQDGETCHPIRQILTALQGKLSRLQGESH